MILATVNPFNIFLYFVYISISTSYRLYILLCTIHDYILHYFTQNANDESLLSSTTKQPKTIAFVIGSDLKFTDKEDLLDKIGQIACWSVSKQIHSISFYDPEGIIASKEEEIVEHFQSKYESVVHHDLKQQSDDIVTYKFKFTTPNETRGSEVIILGKEHSHRQIVNVLFMSYQNSGKPAIASFSQTLIEKYKNDKIYKTEKDKFDNEKIKVAITQDVIDYKKQIFPEPELLLLLSPICVLYGFPPLHLRYTEIIHLQRCISKFTKDDLDHCLEQFSQISQRFGK